MRDLNDLRYFVEVVDHGGFAAASRAIGVPKSRLSRRVAALETDLGVRLIQRSTRRFAVTPTGQNYYAHCKAMLVEAQAAQEVIDLTTAEPRGIVRIACPVALLQASVDAMIAAFMAQYPQVVVHLEASNRRVDVASESVDVALRVRYPPLEDSDLVMKVLGERAQCLVASPLLIRQRSAPARPADLSGWPSIDLGPPQARHAWDLRGPDGAQALIQHEPRLITDDMVALRTAAIAGIGIVQLPTMMLGAALREGSLQRLLPHWAPRPGIVHAVFASRRGLLPSVRALLDFLAARFQILDAGSAALPD